MKQITLTNACPFNLEAVREHEIAYNRLYYRSSTWFNRWFPKNGTGGNKAISDEMEQVSEYLTGYMFKNGLSDINRLFQAGTVDITSDPTKGNLYCIGDYCFYWIRLINRSNDYNLYIHCYKRD